MKSLANIVLNFFSLLEAEGRLFKEKAVLTASGIVAIFIGALCLFAALIIAAFAVYVLLAYYYGPVLAMLIIAAVFAIIGILLIIFGKR